MNTLNLTDEGLSELSNKLYDVTQNNGKSDSIFSILSELRQVRDAAKKETKEKAAVLAGDHYEDHCCEDCPCAYWRENVATAIRQMEGGE